MPDQEYKRVYLLLFITLSLSLLAIVLTYLLNKTRFFEPQPEVTKLVITHQADASVEGLGLISRVLLQNLIIDSIGFKKEGVAEIAALFDDGSQTKKLTVEIVGGYGFNDKDVAMGSYPVDSLKEFISTGDVVDILFEYVPHGSQVTGEAYDDYLSSKLEETPGLYDFYRPVLKTDFGRIKLSKIEVEGKLKDQSPSFLADELVLLNIWKK